jgi:hypothetical protein
MLLLRLGLGLSRDLLPYGFPTKILYVFLFPHACYMSFPTDFLLFIIELLAAYHSGRAV